MTREELNKLSKQIFFLTFTTAPDGITEVAPFGTSRDNVERIAKDEQERLQYRLSHHSLPPELRESLEVGVMGMGDGRWGIYLREQSPSCNSLLD